MFLQFSFVLLTNKFLLQGFVRSRLRAFFRKYYGRYSNLVCQYNLPFDPIAVLGVLILTMIRSVYLNWN
jgi:hypothetical protein